MKFRVVEIDKDYRTKTDEYIEEFHSVEDAEEWAKAESWAGYDYHVYEIEGQVRETPNFPEVGL